MLADGVEASARVLHDPTPQKIREVIDRIVRQRIDQGQLREAPITLAQLEKVKEQFTRVLSGMYHSRIDYPAASGGITAGFGSPQPRSTPPSPQPGPAPTASPNEPPPAEPPAAGPRAGAEQVKSR